MTDILDKVIKTLNTIQTDYKEEHFEGIKEQLINANKKIWYQTYDKFTTDPNYINLLFPLINVENCSKCIDSIKYSLDVMLEFYGWEIIGDGVYRIETNPQIWVKDTINFNRISRMFESLNINHMYRESMLLFLCMCKTASNYQIPEDVFKKWLSFQSFWLPSSQFPREFKKKIDIRWMLNNQVIQKGTPEELSLFLERLCKHFNIIDCNEFINNVKLTEPNNRVKYILDYIK